MKKMISRSSNRFNRTALIPSVLALAAVVLCTACGGKAATLIRLVKTEGAVDILDEKRKLLSPRENLKLYSGYQLETQEISYAWINLDDTKLAKMDQESEIEIQKIDKHLEIHLRSGSLYFDITEPLGKEETLNIRSSNMAVGIRGTCGWVESLDQEHTLVYILEGTVECTVTNPKTSEAVTSRVSDGEMAIMSLVDGDMNIMVEQFGESEIPSFVSEELEEERMEEFRPYLMPEDYYGQDEWFDDEWDSVYIPWEEAGLEDHVMVWGDDNLEQTMRDYTGITDRDIMLSDVWERLKLK